MIFLAEAALLYFKQANQLLVGFSGGLDSTVLLHLLASYPELKPKIKAVHIHHGLSPNANTWATHCSQLAERWGIAFKVEQIQIPVKANLEAAARKARYARLNSFLNKDDCLILAHHQDDQAETVLLQLFRGSGIQGLAAMPVIKHFNLGWLCRPLLHCSRHELEQYAAQHHLVWVEDESNTNSYFSRNFIRHQLFPLIQQRWPGVKKAIARSAGHCQHEAEQLLTYTALDYPEIHYPILKLAHIKCLSLERAQSIIRAWLKANQVPPPNTAVCARIYTEMIQAKVDAQPVITWGKISIRRYQEQLFLLKEKLLTPAAALWENFPLPLEITALQASVCVETVMQEGIIIPPHSVIQIHFNMTGAVIVWHGQHQSLKKLFQMWKIPPWERPLIPLLYINDQLAAVVGYAISDLFYNKQQQLAYRIFLNKKKFCGPYISAAGLSHLIF